MNARIRSAAIGLVLGLLATAPLSLGTTPALGRVSEGLANLGPAGSGLWHRRARGLLAGGARRRDLEAGVLGRHETSRRETR